MRTFSMLVTVLLLVVGSAFALVPTTMNYQGYLTDNVGDPVVDASYSVVFTIYDASVAGVSVWTETQNVTTSNGLFAVQLGTINPIEDTVFSDPTRYLAIEVAGDPELSPRTALVSVPFAFHSVNSDSALVSGSATTAITSEFSDSALVSGSATTAITSEFSDSALVSGSATTADAANTSGFADSTESITDGAIDLSDIGQNGATTNQILKWSGSAWILTSDETGGSSGWIDDGTVMRLDAVDDSVGIGTATPTAKLEVIGDVIVQGKSNIGIGNTNPGDNAHVLGENNKADGDFSTVSGGSSNWAILSFSTIGGGSSNVALSAHSTVGGGEENVSNGGFSTIGGGQKNTSTGISSTISGGNNNTATGTNSNINGGNNNTATGNNSNISGGLNNTSIGNGSNVSGGANNTSPGNSSTVSGGSSNTSNGVQSVVSGGAINAAIGDHSIVSGGLSDTAFGEASTVSGGSTNRAVSVYTTVGGGFQNTASFNSATVSGGSNNNATNFASTVAGGSFNNATRFYTTVAGGFTNIATAHSATVSGGFTNTASRYASTVAGGENNVADGFTSTVSGGTANNASGDSSTVAGGSTNIASGKYSTVSGGNANNTIGNYSTIAGGDRNSASGLYAAVSGGVLNAAQGDYSWAGGRRAKALTHGSFVWGDNTNSIVTSSADNQFIVRAKGGTFIYSDGLLSAGVSLVAGGGAWASISDSTVKENIRPVDGNEILDKISQLDITRWNYESQDKSIEHIGPMAQDFHRLFGVGDNNTTITTIDPDGISLAAIKALIEQNKNLELDNQELNKRLDTLEKLIEKISKK